MNYQDLKKQEFFHKLFISEKSEDYWWCYVLRGTNFGLDFHPRTKKLCWIEIVEDVPFETDLFDILPQLPQEIADEILFNLDYFR